MHLVHANRLSVDLRLRLSCLATCVAHDFDLTHQSGLVLAGNGLRTWWPHTIQHDLLEMYLYPLVWLVIDFRYRDLSDTGFLLRAHVAREVLLDLMHNASRHTVYRCGLGRIHDNLKLMSNFRDAELGKRPDREILTVAAGYEQLCNQMVLDLRLHYA